MIDARQIATSYLRSVSQTFPDGQELLLHAASIYEEEITLLRTALSKGNAFSSKTITDWMHDMRRTESDLILKARDMEATAITELATICN